MTPPDTFPTAAFDYALPPELIATHPPAERDASRLLVLDRASGGSLRHLFFRDVVSLFDPGDVLVLNETRVIPARLLGRRAGGGEAEIVLLHPVDSALRGTESSNSNLNSSPDPGLWPELWVALVRPGARLRAGRRVKVADDLSIEIVDVLEDGSRVVRLDTQLPVRDAVYRHGHVPLPPYIERADDAADRERYQTVFAREEGSVAAPTAGLHFTPAILESLEAKGVRIAKVVLHVGAGTFRPVEVEDPAEHAMHEEWYEVTAPAASQINEARATGGRVWAVGTTVARTLESAADEAGRIAARSGWTRLFIRPGYVFRGVDRLITNFHLPRSTLLMLVSAFAGHEATMRAYRDAIAERYRFYSYGDAMAVL